MASPWLYAYWMTGACCGAWLVWTWRRRQHPQAILALPRDEDDGLLAENVERLMLELAAANQRLQGEVRQLSQALREQSRQAEALARVARTDDLTGLPNRRSFLEELTRRLTDHQRHGASLAVLLLDVDGFKGVNDRWGHAAGDLALRETAACLRRFVRKRDVAARLGGDEFAVLFPKTTLADAVTAAERLRSCVEELAIGDEAISITISIGLAAASEGENAHQLLVRADAALYDAKRSGRNCVCWRESDVDPTGTEMRVAANRPKPQG